MTMTNTTTNEVSVIQGLAMEARALRNCIDVNMWQLARVFVEAKPLVPHGEWGKWLEDNADVGVRTAQDMMAAYRRFGGKPQFENIGRSKAFKLLPLPEEAERAFLEEHDVGKMSVREIEEAVRKAKAEMQGEINREREARLDAEARAADAEDRRQAEAETGHARTEAAEERARDAETRAANADAEIAALKNRPPVIPEEMKKELAESREQLAAAREEIDRMKETGETALEESRRISMENAALRRELLEKDEMLKEQQDDIERVQAELLNVKSAEARGDAERTSADILSAEAVFDAARLFIGQVGRVPYMHSTFALMGAEEREGWRAVILQVKEWAEKSLKAVETINGVGGVIE